MRRATAVAVVAAAALLVACGGGTDSAGTATTQASGITTTTLDITNRVKTYVVTDATHVQGPVDYPQNPPVGGNHSPTWQNCAFYSVPVPTERAVHSMEHGAVWITYRPDLPAAQVRLLQAIAQASAQANPYVIMSPWPDATLLAPVVASAWGVQLTADTAADPGVAAFVGKYANGPQTPEKGAPCTGGTNSTN